jgi:hypothetical protein
MLKSIIIKLIAYLDIFIHFVVLHRCLRASLLFTLSLRIRTQSFKNILSLVRSLLVCSISLPLAFLLLVRSLFSVFSAGTHTVIYQY